MPTRLGHLRGEDAQSDGHAVDLNPHRDPVPWAANEANETRSSEIMCDVISVAFATPDDARPDDFMRPPGSGPHARDKSRTCAKAAKNDSS